MNQKVKYKILARLPFEFEGIWIFLLFSTQTNLRAYSFPFFSSPSPIAFLIMVKCKLNSLKRWE